MSPLRGESNDTGEKQKMSEQKNDNKTQNIRFGIGNKQTIANITYNNCVVFCVEGKDYKTNKLTEKQIDELFDKGLLKRFCEEIAGKVVDKLTSNEELACLLKDAIDKAIENEGKSLQDSLDDYAKNVIDRLDDIKDKLEGLQETTEKGFKRNDDAHGRQDKDHQEQKDKLDIILARVEILPNRIEKIVRNAIQDVLSKTDPKIRYDEKEDSASYENQPMKIDIDYKDIVIDGDNCYSNDSNIEVKAGGQTTSVSNPRGIDQQQLKLLEQIILFMLIRKVASGEKIDWGRAFAQEAFKMINSINNEWTREQESFEDFLLRNMKAVGEKTDNAVAASVDEAEEDQSDSMNIPVEDKYLANYFSDRIGMNVTKVLKDENGKYHICLLPHRLRNRAFCETESVREIVEIEIERGAKRLPYLSGFFNLKKLTLPNTIEAIETSYIAELTSLEEIVIDESNSTYRSVGNCIIKRETNEIVVIALNGTIPDDGQFFIAKGAFPFENVGCFKIPKSVIGIDKNAFPYAQRGVFFCECADEPDDWQNGWSKSLPVVHDWKNNETANDEHKYYVANDQRVIYALAGGKATVVDVLPGGEVVDELKLSSTICHLNRVYEVDKIACASLLGVKAKRIVIPQSIKSIDNGVIGTGNVLFEIVAGGKKEELVVDSYLEEIVVDKDNAFYHSKGNCLIEKKGRKLIAGCRNSVIPEDGSVAEIGEYAFAGVELKQITIPDSVQKIGEGAFYCCLNLKSIDIPDSIVSIGEKAFYYCHTLGKDDKQKVKIPSSVRTMGRCAFTGSINTPIVCETKRRPSGWDKNWNEEDVPVVWGNNWRRFHLWENIAEVACWLSFLTSLVGCAALGLSIAYMLGADYTLGLLGACFAVFPALVVAVYKYAQGKTEWWIDDMRFRDYKRFMLISGITFVALMLVLGLLPTDNIPLWVFSYLLPCAITIVMVIVAICLLIKFQASRRFVAVVCILILAFCCSTFVGVEKVGGWLSKYYDGCLYLERDKELILIDARKDLTEVTIPAEVTSIGIGAFQGCSGLTSVTIPDSVTSIAEDAFKNCNKLTDVYYQGNLKGWLEIEFGNDYANPMSNFYAKNFYINGELLQGDIVIPEGTEKIGAYAFYDFSNLTSITIPDSVTRIGWAAFAGCTGLTSVKIPDGVISIGDWAFSGCSKLTSITIPDGVTYIGDGAFSGCSGLTSITIPFVGEKADGSGETHFGHIFGASSYSSNTGYVPESLKEVIITGGSSIGDRAFYNCSGLTSVTLGNGVTSIGEDAFLGCSGLTDVYYQGDLSGWLGIEFGNYSANPMHDADNLYINGELLQGEIVIPEGTEKIGDYVFLRCSGLTSVTIPDSVTRIGNYAFYGCYGLTSITIPDSVISIGGLAFRSCISLTTINFQGTMAQWQAIRKDGNWDFLIDDYTVYCTDGTISKADAS